MTPETKKKLYLVIQQGLGQNTADELISAEECRELLQIGMRQSIQPIIYNGLIKLKAPVEALREHEGVRYRSVFEYVQRSAALQQISALFDQAGIPYIPLKWAVLCRLYPEPYLRSSCDLDMLVHEDDIEQAVSVLENRTAFTVLRKSYHDISLLNATIHLELHFSIKENMESIDELLKKAWDFTSPSGNGQQYDFTPEYQIFHVITHMLYHFLHGGIGIRPFLDLWLLRHKTEYDENIVRAMCSECGILLFYEECCRLAEVWMGREEETETSRMLEEFCLAGGIFGTEQFKNAARQRKRRGMGYIISRVFPPAYQVKEFYGDETEKKHRLLYYYLKRLKSWFSKERRAELNRQMQAIITSNSGYLDKTRELLERLGL